MHGKAITITNGGLDIGFNVQSLGLYVGFDKKSGHFQDLNTNRTISLLSYMCHFHKYNCILLYINSLRKLSYTLHI